MKKQRKNGIRWYILAAAVVVAGYFLFLAPDEVLQIEYRTDRVSRGDVSVVVTATGTLEAVTTVEVGSQVSGRISKLYADFNTIVKAGDVVAQIDPTTLEAQVTENEANLQRLQALAAEARRNMEVSRNLFEKGLVSEIEHQATVTSYDVALANVKVQEAALDRSKVNLEYATIRAPIDGVVISRDVDVGQTVAASLSAPTIFEIANDLTKMQVSASIDEADIGKINTGQPVSFTVDAFPDRNFRGRVSEVRLEPIESSNVITYNVIIDVPNDDLILMPGLTANVSILCERKSDVLVVPARALRYSPTDTTAILKENVPQTAKKTTTDEFDTTGLPAVQKRSVDMLNAQAGTTTSSTKRSSATSARPTPPVGGPGAAGGPLAGMSREDIRKKIMSMTPAEREALRQQFGGMRPRKNTNFDTPPDFQEFKRSEMLSATTTSSDKAARVLTQKWSKNTDATKSEPAYGTVWLLTPEKQLKAVRVQTGLSDGTSTEILSGDLKEGDDVIIMELGNSSSGTTSQRSPMPGPRF